MTCAFPAKCSAFNKSPLNEEWVQWAFEYSSMSNKMFDKIKGLGLFGAYFYPFCDDIHRYECLSKNWLLFFVFDDHTENNDGDIHRNPGQSIKIWQQFGQILDKLEGKPDIWSISWKPYVMAMFATLEMIYQSFNETQKERFISCWKLYMKGNLEETQSIAEGKRISIKDYKKVRKF